MKTQLVTYVHSCNGVSIHLIPETAEERVLLRAIWRFGRLEKCNSPPGDCSGEGFSIHWSLKADGDEVKHE